MVLIFNQTLQNLHSKLENHQNQHNHESTEAISASLLSFQSKIFTFLNQFSSNLTTISLKSIQQCFMLVPMINKAFTKLVLDLDYPVNKWESKSIDEYLNYSLNLLDLLNSISSCLSHLGHARLCFSHALSLISTSPALAIEHMKATPFSTPYKDFKFHETKQDHEKGTCFCDKEVIIQQALFELKSIGTWVCCVVLACLSSHSKTYLEMREFVGVVSNSSLNKLDSSVCEVMKENGCVLEEVKELKEAATLLESDISSVVVEDLQRKLKAFEKGIDSLGKEVDCVFPEVLAGRSELLGCFRLKTEQQ